MNGTLSDPLWVYVPYTDCFHKNQKIICKALIYAYCPYKQLFTHFFLGPHYHT